MGRGRSKDRRLIHSFRIVECALLAYRGILFHCPRPLRLQISADEGYKPTLLLRYEMNSDLKEPTYSVLDGEYAILRPKVLQ